MPRSWLPTPAEPDPPIDGESRTESSASRRAAARPCHRLLRVARPPGRSAPRRRNAACERPVQLRRAGQAHAHARGHAVSAAARARELRGVPGGGRWALRQHRTIFAVAIRRSRFHAGDAVVPRRGDDAAHLGVPGAQRHHRRAGFRARLRHASFRLPVASSRRGEGLRCRHDELLHDGERGDRTGVRLLRVPHDRRRGRRAGQHLVHHSRSQSDVARHAVRHAARDRRCPRVHRATGPRRPLRGRGRRFLRGGAARGGCLLHEAHHPRLGRSALCEDPATRSTRSGRPDRG